MAGDIQTPFTAPTCPTPSGAGSGGGTSGGFDLGDGSQKESANMSALPPLQTTVDPGEGAPGVGSQIPMPPVASPGTIPSSGTGN